MKYWWNGIRVGEEGGEGNKDALTLPTILFKYYILKVYLCATLKHLKEKNVKEIPDQQSLMRLLCCVFQDLLKFYQPFKSHSNATFPNLFQKEGYFLLVNVYRDLCLFMYAVPLSLSCILVMWQQIRFPLLDGTCLKSRKYSALHVTCQKRNVSK